MRKSLKLLLAVLAIAASSYGQTGKFYGKVTDVKDGSPMVGVTIKVKGGKGGISASDGTFSFETSQAEANLEVSTVGYSSRLIKAKAGEPLNITLEVDSKALSEVVVTGIGTATSKRKLGIAVESVSADKLPPAPTASIDQALVGKIPGAQISSISGNPGDPTNILLRGINTVQGGTKPIILVDGIQIGATDINQLDLSNVERVEVVQGAASATIYGAQGANGVIQVFTKKGKKGKPAINFSSSYSWNQFVNNGDVHKARLHSYLTDASGNILDVATNEPLEYNEVGSIEGIAYKFGGAGRYFIQDIQNDNNQPYNANLKYYDHFKQVFQTGYTFNNSINVSGAGERSDYAFSVSNSHTLSPVLKNGSYDRSNITANMGMEIFKGFKIRSITQAIYTRNTMLPSMGAGGGGGSKGNVGSTYSFLNTSPFFDLSRKLEDGTYPQYQTADFLSVNAGNPYYRTMYSSSRDNRIDIVQNFNANYQVNKFLELDAKYGINYSDQEIRYTFKNQSQNLNAQYYTTWVGWYQSNFTGEIDNFQNKTTYQNFLGSAFIKTDWQRDFNSKLPITTSTQLTYDYRKNKYEGYTSYGLGLPLNPPINVTATGSQVVNYDYVEPFITYGFLVNQKIDFGDWGGVTGGFRSDYSSAFGGGSKPFTFPHFDGYVLPFNIFAKNSGINNALPYFKLRAAYGEAGIQPGAFDRYPVLDQGNLGTALAYSFQAGSANPDLSVEVSKELEIGTDFTINTNPSGSWFSMINGSLTYWDRKSENVIYTVSAAPSTGTTGIKTNAMDLSSHGVQFSINTPVYSSRNFKWDFTVNFGKQISFIDKINGGADIITSSGAGDAAIVLTEGAKIGQIYGYAALTSLDAVRTNGVPYIDEGDKGAYEIVDGRVVNKETYQMQFADEKTPIGDPNPKFNMSFINGVSFKDFVTLNFQFDWVYGSHLYNQTKEWMYRDGIHGDFEGSVTIDGKTGAFPAYWSSAYYNLWGSLRGAGNNATKDFYWEDASFVRLRNVSLGFDVARIAKIPYFKKAQIVFTGRNVLTFTKYTGFDPEISSGTTNSAFDRGVDHSTLPNIKSYQIGINLGF